MIEGLSKGAKALESVAIAKGRGGWSRIAEELGCAQSAVSRWANGKSRPEIDWVNRIHKLYGVDPALWSVPSTD